MHIILFILLFLGVIAILGLSIVGAILRAVFGIGRRSSSRSKQARSGEPNQQPYRPNQNSQPSSDNEEELFSEETARGKHKKIFSKDDGEYVDFEEVKE